VLHRSFIKLNIEQRRIMRNSNSNNRTRSTSNRYYKKIAKGVYQTGLKSFKATKRVNGVTTTKYATNKTAAIRLYKTL
jgi:hypothetical protein